MSNPSDDTRPVWLVKLPQFLGDFVVAKSVTNEDIGVLGTVTQVAGTGKSKAEGLRFQLTAVAPELDGKPTAFVVKERPVGPQQLKAFAETSAGSVAMVGSVVVKADMIPDGDAKYGAMIKAKVARKEEKILSVQGRKDASRKLAEMTAIAEERRMKDREAQNLHAVPDQRIDMTKQQMITALLSLFEEEEYWKKSEILNRTNQPDKLVSDALKELAIMHTSGEHKHHYQLKAEFKIHKRQKTTDGDE